MKQVLVKGGHAEVEEVPAPRAEPGRVLVRVLHSCISVGTEMSGMKEQERPLWQKALAHPDKVVKVLVMAATEGVRKTRNKVEGKLNSGHPTGYSAAGVVVETGEGIHDLEAGQLVACAGAQCAHHAEYISVPRNLTVPVPEGVDSASACTVTLGAIALQGVRRAQPTLGESFVVLGLGVLGQITVQLLKANGCRVLGIDLERERLRQALAMGMDVGLHPDDSRNPDQVRRLTHGFGADGVIITAATSSHEVVGIAFSLCRRKGRVVLVGDVGLHLNRADFYQKELDFLISTSYGPGRYDRSYEEEGLDYPISYVRWTENRNMAAYLDLLAEGRLRIEPLISKVYPVDEAPEAYASLEKPEEKPLMVLLSYPKREDELVTRLVRNPLAAPAQAGRVRLGLAGAGGFAKGTHLPNLLGLSSLFHLQSVMSRSGHNAVAVARQYGAAASTTDYQALLADPEVEAVLIATRHDLHASMALQALQAGKHVLVEKPLALTREELREILAFYEGEETKPRPMLLTGFNRRFSRYAAAMKEALANRSNPMVMVYRMNAGHIPTDHWVHGPEGGGRNIGEACHIYDLFTFLAESGVKEVSASALRPATEHYLRNDNFSATIRFRDGSLATLIYTSLGSKEYPKEQMEIYFDGKVLVLEDYKRLSLVGARLKPIETPESDKGQREELEAFGRAIQKGGPWPLPLREQAQAMEIAFEVERLIGGQA